MCCVYRLQTMIWKYAKLSYHLPLIDSATLRHGVGKCICMCLIDDLKLNHSRIWLYIEHQIFSLLIYPKQKLSNQITQTEIVFKPLIFFFKKKKKIPIEVLADWWWEVSITKVVASQIPLSLSYKCFVNLRCFILVIVKLCISFNNLQHFRVSLSLPRALYS